MSATARLENPDLCSRYDSSRIFFVFFHIFGGRRRRRRRRRRRKNSWPRPGQVFQRAQGLNIPFGRDITNMYTRLWAAMGSIWAALWAVIIHVWGTPSDHLKKTIDLFKKTTNFLKNIFVLTKRSMFLRHQRFS